MQISLLKQLRVLSIVEKYKVAGGTKHLCLIYLAYTGARHTAGQCVLVMSCAPGATLTFKLARFAITVEHFTEAAPKIVSTIQETRRKNRAPDSDLNTPTPTPCAGDVGHFGRYFPAGLGEVRPAVLAALRASRLSLSHVRSLPASEESSELRAETGSRSTARYLKVRQGRRSRVGALLYPCWKRAILSGI